MDSKKEFKAFNLIIVEHIKEILIIKWLAKENILLKEIPMKIKKYSMQLFKITFLVIMAIISLINLFKIMTSIINGNRYQSIKIINLIYLLLIQILLIIIILINLISLKDCLFKIISMLFKEIK